MTSSTSETLDTLYQRLGAQDWQYVIVEVSDSYIKAHIRLFEHDTGEQMVRIDYRSTFSNPMLREYMTLRSLLTEHVAANCPETTKEHTSRLSLTVTAERMADDGKLETAVIFEGPLHTWKNTK